MQVWWRSSHVCGRSSGLRVKVYRQTDASRLHKLIRNELILVGAYRQLGPARTQQKTTALGKPVADLFIVRTY